MILETSIFIFEEPPDTEIAFVNPLASFGKVTLHSYMSCPKYLAIYRAIVNPSKMLLLKLNRSGVEIVECDCISFKKDMGSI